MAVEHIALTIRGNTHAYDIDSAAVDILLTAFRTLQPPPEVPTEPGDPGHDPSKRTMKPNPIGDTEHFARRLRIYSEQVALEYAKRQDAAITPNQDAIAPFIAGTEV